MAPAVTVQQSSDQGVIQRAAQKRDSSTPVEKVLQEPKTSVPVLLLVAGAAAALIWWNKRGSTGGKGSKGESSSRSRFAFPGGKESTRAGTDAPASTLPRNKQAVNNKKNKSRRREEKHRRAEKRDRLADVLVCCLYFSKLACHH
ncbi:hypothetical protein ABBQ32_008913 [Trebouxia sp. C0010 RCD-2024]